LAKIAQTKVLGNMTATVPKSVALALDLKVGDHLEWHIKDGKIIVRKMKIKPPPEARRSGEA
jgi:bifunctional DNA-binding transcriptional regulator/antitoxin component of YhaV-PrlF toxin-antitoxin module